MYNLEVAGVHAYRVTPDGVLVHNNCGVLTHLHHYATHINKEYTPKLKEIADQYGLHLNGSWNKGEFPAGIHNGRHPNEYHKFVLEQMQKAAKDAEGSTREFLKLFDLYVKQVIQKDPELLRKRGWQ